jgi:hypothetical protein
LAKFDQALKGGTLSLQTRVIPVSEEEIMKKRLTLDGIREIPRFSDYSPGEPSKVRHVFLVS